jgi:hypothetical protein
VTYTELWRLPVIHADILLQWKQEAEEKASRDLGRFLRSRKGKNTQAVVDVGRAFLG